MLTVPNRLASCNLFEYRSLGNHSIVNETTFEPDMENMVLQKKRISFCRIRKETMIQCSLYLLADNTSNKGGPLIF
jgi:hypothetical protein